MMIEELYEREPVRVDKNLSVLKGMFYNHVEEVEYNCLDVNLHRIGDQNQNIEIKYYADAKLRERRNSVWLLASVWYEDMPVMVIQNAGRSGDDYVKRFITDESLYQDMLDYIHFLLDLRRVDHNDLYREDEAPEDLLEFFGHKLEDFI